MQTASEDFISWFSGQFFAHTHKDDFRLQTIPLDSSVGQQDLGKSFVLIAPAISPVYHNNPAFRLLSLDTEKLLIMDYTQYYMDIVMATGKIVISTVTKLHLKYNRPVILHKIKCLEKNIAFSNNKLYGLVRIKYIDLTKTKD